MVGRIGKYEIIRMLGEGAMGKVYLGRDPSLGREVAIKTIRPESSFGEESRQRFNREAKAAGALNHPNLVTIHEFGEDEGTLFIVMEFVAGEDLQALLRQQRLSPPEILEVIAQVCDGLAYAHARGVMHRDIKPSNVQVSHDLGRLHAKVMDFGIARISGSDMTGTGTLLGTFGYMAPEYIQTGVPDHRSDLFAVGVMLYEALSGQRPFNGDTMATVLYRIVNDQPKAVDATCLQGISPKVSAVLHRALAKDPGRRYQTAQEMANAVREAKNPAWPGYPDMDGATTVLSDRTAVPVKVSVPSATAWWRKAWLLGAGLMVLGGAAAWAWVRQSQPKPAPMVQNPASAVVPVVPPPPAVQAVKSEPPAVQPPVPAPAKPAASPRGEQPAAPVAPPTKTASELLDAAAKELETNPQAALVTCKRILAEEPDNVRAHALGIVALYRLERYGAMGEATKEARLMGILPRHMMRIPRFAEMTVEEARERRIPREETKGLFQKGGIKPREHPRRFRERSPE